LLIPPLLGILPRPTPLEHGVVKDDDPDQQDDDGDQADRGPASELGPDLAARLCPARCGGQPQKIRVGVAISSAMPTIQLDVSTSSFLTVCRK
jgi:hypothetical protein